jgi:hypothetical protein
MVSLSVEVKEHRPSWYQRYDGYRNHPFASETVQKKDLVRVAIDSEVDWQRDPTIVRVAFSQTNAGFL